MIEPTIGRMVYYHTRGSADGAFPPTNFAAIITEVINPTMGFVSLVTFGPSGMRFEQSVQQGEGAGCWDWMPFQKDQVARMASGTLNESHPMNDSVNTVSPDK